MSSGKKKRKRQAHDGKISIITGCMFSGKSRELMRRLDVRRIKNKSRCVLFKHASDTRYHKTAVASHNGLIDDTAISCSSLSEVEKKAKGADYVFVDEGQFFDDLAAVVLRWARQGKHVTVALLDAYSNQTMWPQTIALLPWCTDLCKLNAVCFKCGGDASLSVSHLAKNPGVGGIDKYQASCIHCCENKKKNKK